MYPSPGSRPSSESTRSSRYKRNNVAFPCFSHPSVTSRSKRAKNAESKQTGAHHYLAQLCYFANNLVLSRRSREIHDRNFLGVEVSGMTMFAREGAEPTSSSAYADGGQAGDHLAEFPRRNYFTRERRRWTSRPRTRTKSTPATMRTIVVSMLELLSSLSMEEILEFFRHQNDCRSQSDKKQTWKDEEHKRKDQFDGRLRCHLFHCLNTLRPQCFRMSPQSLCNAGAELLRLNQHRNQVAHYLNICALRHVPPRFRARAPGALFKHHNVQLIGDDRMRWR